MPARLPGTARAGERSRRAWSLATTLALVGAVVLFVPRGEIAAALGRARAGWVALAWTLALANVWVASAQLRVLTAALGLSFSTGRLFAINLATQLHGLALPGQTGGLVRWYRLARAEGRPGRALAAIVLARAADTLAVATLGAACWLADAGARGSRTTAVAGLVVVVALGAAAIVLAGGAVRPLRRVAVGLARRGARWPRRALRPLAMLERGGRLAQRTRVELAAVSLLRAAVGLAALVCLVRALDLDLAWVTLGWVRAALRLLTWLPVSISGIGLREGGFVVLLRPYGIEPGAAVALSLLVLTQILVRALAGAGVEIGARLGTDRGWRAGRTGPAA